MFDRLLTSSSKKEDFTIMLKVVKISSGGRGNHDANE